MTEGAAPVVMTPAGAVRGVWRGDEGSPSRSAAFLGIPFAKPPVGPLRFGAPEPAGPWDDVLDATSYGATPQRWVPDEPTLIPEPSVPGPSTLNVNVFTPRPGDVSARLPVLVWIHGGGYVSGSPASPWYDGRAFNRDGVVTVSVSYRLGFDGFGWIDGAPQNRGVLDWLCALEWVAASIREFGGDPGAVTIAGQSAGGGAVLTLLGMPRAQHLFRRAIAVSPAIADIPEDRARATSARLAATLGVDADRDGFASAPEKRIERHQVPSTREPGESQLEALRAVFVQAVPYGPVIDGELIPARALDAIRSGIGADKELVIGATDDEFTMIADAVRNKLRFIPVGLALARIEPSASVRRAYLADNGTQRRRGTAAVLGRFVSDRVFRTTVVRTAEARGASPTWVYRFSWRSPTRGWAFHCLDVPFWFDCLGDEHVARIAGDSPPPRLAEAMHGSAAAFVRTGDPGWTPWSLHDGATRVFGGAASAPDVDRDGYASVRALL